MNSINAFKWAAVIGCACSSGLIAPAHALVLTLENAAFLGELTGGGGRNRDELHIQQLAAMAPGSVNGVRGVTYRRSENLFSALPDALPGLEINQGPAGIVLDGTDAYLLARYGSTTLIWSVAGLVGTFDLPASRDGRHHFSRYSLARGIAPAGVPQPNGTPVADSGTTLALLGLGIGALGAARGTVRPPRSDA
jgi:hypothetical protein